jgi:hypothetical protein
MQELDQHTITAVSLEQMSATRDRRFKELMDAAVRYLHAYAREVDPLEHRREIQSQHGHLDSHQHDQLAHCPRLPHGSVEWRWKGNFSGGRS